ncbi:MAG: hypothetical protein K0S80_4200, partial [Neobacillus sp.]|nr:hypothetical protein [Neobacillus sp.]
NNKNMIREERAACRPILIHSHQIYPPEKHFTHRDIIYPVTPNEHFNGWHGGNWKNSLPGKPINPIEDF